MSAQGAAPRRRVAFQAVGCKLNLYEIEALKDGFDHQGYEIVPFDSEAEVYVVNTCTVTGSGDADSRRAVRRAGRAHPGATVVATGCYAQRRPGELSAAGAHLVVGNAQKAALLERVEAHLRGISVPAFDPRVRPHSERFLSIEGAVRTGRTRGTLQIQQGCDEHCTYCIIPAVRGAGISRPAAEILAQARRMVAAGYRELALTGVHSGSYGSEWNDTGALVGLLRELEAIDGLARIRLNSIEPGHLSDALVDHAAASRKFCRHFHVPLQSGDNRILRRMGRRYDRRYYAGRLERLARLIPHCAIGADVMVGFPGEEEQHFANTCSFIADLPLSYLHVFSYSLRPGTPAARLPGHQSKRTRSERTRCLIALGARKRLEFHRRFVGRTLEVLVEDHRDKATGLATGLSDNYIKVLFAAGRGRVNQFVPVRIARAREALVFGEIETE